MLDRLYFLFDYIPFLLYLQLSFYRFERSCSYVPPSF